MTLNKLAIKARKSHSNSENLKQGSLFQRRVQLYFGVKNEPAVKNIALKINIYFSNSKNISADLKGPCLLVLETHI